MDISHFKVKKLPDKLCPNAIYYVISNDDTIKIFVTTYQCEPKEVSLSNQTEFVQNNKPKHIDLGDVQPTGETLLEEIASAVNQASSFEVKEDEVLFITVTISGTYYLFTIKNKGRGTYGVGSSNIILPEGILILHRDRIYTLEKDEDENDIVLNENGEEVSRISLPAIEFTDNNVQDLLALLYEEGFINMSRSPASFEENLINGVSVTFNYSVTLNDDILQSAIYGGNTVTQNPSGSETLSNIKNTVSRSYSVTFKNSIDLSFRTVSLTRTAQSLIPQWKGSTTVAYTGSDISNFDYTTLGSDFDKIVQSSDNTSITVNPGEYGYFISKNNNATIIEDGTGFEIAPTAFLKETVTVEYQDGTPLALTMYRVQPSNGIFIYNLG